VTDEAGRFQLAFAAALARQDEAEEQEDPSPGPNAEPLDTDARRIAEVVLRDPEMAALITGDTAEELLRDAHRVRKALDAAIPKPEVNFDGGVREPAPAPADHAREHDQTVLQIVQEARWGRSNL
jgi:hypothetical protein